MGVTNCSNMLLLSLLQDPDSYTFEPHSAEIVSTVFLSTCTVFALLGVRTYSLLAVVLFFIKMGAVAVALISFLAVPGHSVPGNNATCVQSMDCFTAFSPESFESNLVEHVGVQSVQLCVVGGGWVEGELE